jgi:hypothetical protein
MSSIHDRLPIALIPKTFGMLDTTTCKLICSAWNRIASDPVVARASAEVMITDDCEGWLQGAAATARPRKG